MTCPKPSGLVLPVPVTVPPSPKSLKATTLTLYSVLAVRAFNEIVVLCLVGNLNLSFIYTLCLTIRSPVVVGGAVQVITSSSHDPRGGDIMRLLGLPGTG